MVRTDGLRESNHPSRIADEPVFTRRREPVVAIVATVERERDRQDVDRRVRECEIADAAIEVMIIGEQALAIAEAAESFDFERAGWERDRVRNARTARHGRVADDLRFDLHGSRLRRGDDAVGRLPASDAADESHPRARAYKQPPHHRKVYGLPETEVQSIHQMSVSVT